MTDDPLATMDLARFRGRLLALLERIAVALETANATDPVALIQRALDDAAGERPADAGDAPGDRAPADRFPAEEGWRLR